MPTQSNIRKSLINNRDFIMTIAILWIGVFHFPINTNLPVIGFIKSIGYGGVDLFVMLSGFGLYHSLLKFDNDNYINVGAFLKNRAKRMLPSYFPFLIIWIICKKLFDKIYMTEIFGNITMTGWWNGDQNQFNWYLDLLLLLYLLAPIIYTLIKQSANIRRTFVFLMVFAFCIGVAFFHGQLIQAMSRLPIFLIGMLIGDLDNPHWNNAPKLRAVLDNKFFWIAISVLGFVLMYLCMHQTRLDLWHYGLYWYPFLLITPGLAILLANIGNHLPHWCGGLGRASLEIFLWHIGIYELLLYRVPLNLIPWIGIFVLGFTVGYGYHQLIRYIKKKFI